MLVSVLMPTWNRAELIGQAIESILNQTFTRWVLYIYDDGSTDNTEEIVKSYKDPRIHYIKGEHHEVGYARNQLLEMVNTPYFCWQDSDDVSHPERLKKEIEAIGDYDGVFTYLNFFKHPNMKRTRIFELDTTRWNGTRASIFNNCTFATGMFKADIARIKFPEIKTKEDYYWIVDLMAYEKKFTHIPEPLYWCRRHPGRLTQNT